MNGSTISKIHQKQYIIWSLLIYCLTYYDFGCSNPILAYLKVRIVCKLWCSPCPQEVSVPWWTDGKGFCPESDQVPHYEVITPATAIMSSAGDKPHWSHYTNLSPSALLEWAATHKPHTQRQRNITKPHRTTCSHLFFFREMQHASLLGHKLSTLLV